MSGSTRSGLARRILGIGKPERRSLKRMGELEVLEDRQLLAAAIGTTPIVQKPTTSTMTMKAAIAPQPIVPLNQTFNLSSRPSATKTIYLDFDGNTTSNTPWNSFYTNGQDFTTPAFDMDGDPSTFSTAELLQIQRMWQRVVEDFAPFDVNVTTKDPGLANIVNSGAGDTHYGIHVVIGGDNNQWLKQSAGGIAYIGSFGSSTDIPCFAFSTAQGNDEQVCVETISHETGHTLGLSHDGTATLGYYPGHGTSPMSWGPIMGASFGIDITQWSKGEYPGANNTEDDLAIITSQNGFGYRNDDYGNNRQTASQLPTKKVGSIRNVSAAGVIEKNTDQDWFSFTTTGGTVNLSFNGDPLGANLDISVSLYDSQGTLLMVVNPALSLNAQLSATLPAGTYLVAVDGVGYGTLSTGYSDYGSLGQYTITGTIPDTSSGTANGGSSTITGRVVSDANADGILNGTDAGISGVMVFVDLDGNGVFNAGVDKSALTDSSGNYQFTGLLGGTYSIYQVVPAGWQQVRPGIGGQSVFVAAASTTSNVFFRDARPPVLTGMNSAVSYVAGSTAVLLTPNANVTDADTTVFKNATLTVSLTQNNDPLDVLSVRNQGNGAGQVGYFGGVVRYSGVAVGTVSGGVAGSNLVITFNSSATLAIVKAVIKNLTFSSGLSASKLTRTAIYSLSDGTGTTSNTATNLVKVS